MGFYWQAEMEDGSSVNEHHMNWKDVDLHNIKLLKLISTTVPKRIVQVKKPESGFVEFIQFKTAVGTVKLHQPIQPTVESYAIGYTDGEREYYTRVFERSREVVFETLERRTHFHPKSKK